MPAPGFQFSLALQAQPVCPFGATHLMFLLQKFTQVCQR
jgi:hypothetical protein